MLCGNRVAAKTLLWPCTASVAHMKGNAIAPALKARFRRLPVSVGLACQSAAEACLLLLANRRPVEDGPIL